LDLSTKQAKYLEFASNIHFFEFVQEEYKKSQFKVEKYEKEIKEISDKVPWNVKGLAKLLRENPESYEIFEEIFQLIRFTNAQVIHFLFDTTLLNSTDKGKIIDSLKHNLIHDPRFFSIFTAIFEKNEFGQLEFKNEFKDKEKLIDFIESNRIEEIRNYFVMLFKLSIIKYTMLAIKNAKIIHDRLKNENFIDVSERTAYYLINNLKLNDILKGIKLKEFLEVKRIPIDNKSIHGNFGKIKIASILKNHGFIDSDTLLNECNIKTLPHELKDIPELEELKGKFAFATERYVKDVNKKENDKPKRFDFVLIYDLKPKILIETNFYSTTGGRNMLFELYDNFGDNVLNYNMFDKRLEEIKNTLMR